MKKLITVLPHQNIKPAYYGDETGTLYPECQKPVMNIATVTALANIAKDDDFKVYVIDSMHDEGGEMNYKNLCDELKSYYGDHVMIERVDAPLTYTNRDQLLVFKKLYGLFEKGDEVYLDITYGYKPLPMTIMTALNYAKKFVDNIRVMKIVYGHYDFSHKDDNNYIHKLISVTSIFYLDQLIDTLSSMNVKDPMKFIDQVFPED